MSQMPDVPMSPDALKARGFLRLAVVFACLSAFLAIPAIMIARDVPRLFAATEVTADDFTNGTDQAILSGVMQVRQTRLDLEEATEMSLQLTGGGSLTVFTPFTDANWAEGDPIDVIIVSPIIGGVTEQNMQVAAQGYMNELTAPPDNDILVTLLPDDLRSGVAGKPTTLNGISDETIYVWADHVNAISFAPKQDDLGFLPPIVTFLIALGFFIASRVFKNRALRT